MIEVSCVELVGSQVVRIAKFEAYMGGEAKTCQVH